MAETARANVDMQPMELQAAMAGEHEDGHEEAGLNARRAAPTLNQVCRTTQCLLQNATHL
jgi:hypothetical protein